MNSLEKPLNQNTESLEPKASSKPKFDMLDGYFPISFDKKKKNTTSEQMSDLKKQIEAELEPNKSTEPFSPILKNNELFIREEPKKKSFFNFFKI